MSYFYAVLLGVVEGITEFLPVSSTAHLTLTSALLRVADDEFAKSFSIIIQLGAILAVVAIYWRKLLDWRLLTKVAVAFVPTGIIGLTIYRVIKSYLLGNVLVTLGALFVGGVVLILFDRQSQPSDEPVNFDEITYGRAVAIGFCQTLAVIPGVSRSAATIVGGALLGVSKRTIVEFSFLLAIPTMAAATGLELLKGYRGLMGNFDVLAIGFIVSGFTAWLAVTTFLNYVKRHSFAAFGWYRMVLAVAFYLAFVR